MNAVTHLVKNSHVIPNIDIKELTEKQRLIVRKMPQKAESFSNADDDDGRAEELQVDINLTDSVPLQTSSNMLRMC